MSFWRTYYHLIWATKKREPLINPVVETRLFSLIEEKATQLHIPIHALNGWVDHIHLVVSIPPKYSIAETVQSLKEYSAHQLNKDPSLNFFKWQNGYGVLTLGESQLNRAIDYVRNQKEHHSNQSTNIWLERIEPPDSSSQPKLSEPTPLYDIPSPF